MSEFNFKSQVCTDKVQSERLLALGLKKETADMAITNPHFDKMLCVPIEHCLNPEHCIPAWSLGRLIEMIQDVCCRIAMVYSWVRIENPCMPCVDYSYDSFDDTYDNLIGCIEWLIKEGYFNKEYLENGNC